MFTKFNFFVLVALAAAAVGLSHGATVDDRGGYSILFAIDEETPEPGNVGAYLQNLRHSLQVFSSELARATNGVFYIKAADLLVPKNWTVEALPATTQSVAGADIRLFNSDILPHADNPNKCGLSGKQIHLPKTFFDSLNTGTYGPSWKALLTLWARFRWGVWEEHGYPEDSKFAYFYVGDTPDHWEASYCSHEKLDGVYENLDGEVCAMDQAARPSESCRFKPSPISSAPSSLLSFHWLESAAAFCDRLTHNPRSPTRQNLFCNYQSVWEVVRETLDYKMATSGESWSGDIPLPNFRILQHVSTARPVYLLLDRGAMDAHSQPIHAAFVHGVGTLFGELGDDVVVTVAEYPGERYDSILEQIPWDTLGNIRDRVIDEIADWPIDGPSDRHFSSALLKAIQAIERTDFTHGAALVVVKTGTYYSTNMEFEESVYIALAKNHIKLYAAEITNPNLTDFVHMPQSLKALSDRTGGGYANLYDRATAAADFEVLADEIAAEILVPAIPSSSIEILHREIYLDENVELTVDLRKRSTVSVHLTTTKSTGAVLRIRGPQNPVVDISDEWAKPDTYLRHTHSYVHPYNEAEDELHLSYVCEPPGGCGGSPGFLVITEKFDAEEHEASRVKISVSTSAEPFGDVIDFELTRTPFVVYAKIELDGNPVHGAGAVATVSYGTAAYSVILRDDGTGTPDVQSQDGIYSGEFIPPWDGYVGYTVAVRLMGPAAAVGQISDGGFGRLLPEDQIDIGTGPTTVALTQDMSVVANLPGSISLTSVDRYPGINRPVRIEDFTAERDAQVTDRINFHWTVPSILGTNLKVVRYVLFASGTIFDLIGDPHGQMLAYLDNRDEEPGLVAQHSMTVLNTNFIYFAIESFTDDSPVPSQLSNVARLYRPEA